jgi:ATP-dependent DNA helicase PIF1
MLQTDALTILKTGANVFLTGEPGSGKTHTINQYVYWLQRNNVWPAITASTGIAATHIGGATIHSWSGIGILEDLTERDLDTISQNERVVKRVRNTPVLIIDEVSMLSYTTLDMVDKVLRELRGDERAFGGIQIVLVGDFFQLPPVVKRGQIFKKEKIDYDTASYDEFDQSKENSTAYSPNAFSFLSNAWKNGNFLTCYLDEQYRQADTEFLSLLSAIRSNDVDTVHHEMLQGRIGPAESSTQLYAHNVNVDSVNSREISKLGGRERAFVMTGSGGKFLIEKLKSGCLSPEQLVLKVGAKVMFTKNDPEGRYANGTLGTVVSFDSANHFPIVELSGGANKGKTILAEPTEWRLDDAGKTLAQIQQVPLRLAWAITIHKSQGMSLDSAHIDLSNVFEYGQGYVALSRVRTLAGITLTGINRRALEVHPAVLEKDKELRDTSRATEAAFAEMTDTEKLTMQKNFIKAAKGTWYDAADATHAGSEESNNHTSTRLTKPKKVAGPATHKQTLTLIEEGFTLAETAKKREVAVGTILDHLQLALDQRLVRREHISHIAGEHVRDIVHIHKIIDELGIEKLKPIYDRANGTYSYDVIRIARVLYAPDRAEDSE